MFMRFMRNVVQLVHVCLVGLVVTQAAQAAPLAYRGLIGSLNNYNQHGELGFVHATAISGNPSEGNFGAIFDSRVTVNSITIDQRVDPGRHRMKDLRIYTSPFTFASVQLTDNQGPQTVTLPGAGLASDYFFITVESLYDAGAVDNNPGLHGLSFDGSVGATHTNLNALLPPTAVGQFEPENYFVDVVTNGMNVSTTGGPVDYLFFEHADATERSITVDYGTPQTVGSVGLAFEGQILSSYNSRPVPKFVTIKDSNGNERQVDIHPGTLQYGQYPLATPLTNTTSLTMTLPVGVENYYIPELLDPNLPTDTKTGVIEFEAFADAVAPPVEDADFNNDGVVDGADFLVWQSGFGAAATNLTGDANGDGAANADDLAIWKGKFGTAGASASVAAVPEPVSIGLIAFPVAVLLALRSRRSSPARR